MSNPYGNSSLLVSDYIISTYGNNFTPFQLIKMVYISHGVTLAALGKPLIRDRIEAWRYGPVIPVLYHELKRWNDDTVKELSYCGTKPDDLDSDRQKFLKTVIGNDKAKIINDVVKNYKEWSFKDLQKLCHEPGSPWDRHYNGKYGTEIPDVTICNYYKKELSYQYE